MKHVIFLCVMAFYIVQIGQNWAVFSATLMMAAWHKHDGRLLAPL